MDQRPLICHLINLRQQIDPCVAMKIKRLKDKFDKEHINDSKYKFRTFYSDLDSMELQYKVLILPFHFTFSFIDFIC